jgi:CRP-like cAMP-binding protein
MKPTAADLTFIRALLRELGVTDRVLEPHLELVEARRQTVLARPGDDPNCSGVVISGLVREYYVLADGTERTRAFALEKDAFGSLADALLKRPARVFVRAETATRAVRFSWQTIEQLAQSSLEWERLKARVIERLYLRKSAREYELLALDAMERYQALLAQHPRLVAQVAQQHIASYLGITPVHLSRLRRRLVRAHQSARR